MVSSVAEPELVDLRCPSDLPGRDEHCHPGKLLARLRSAGQRPSYVHPDNLIELECRDCKANLRRLGRPVVRVLHRFDFAGQPAGTLVVEEDQGGLAVSGRGISRVETIVPCACAAGAFLVLAGAAALRWRSCCDLPGRACRGDRYVCGHGRVFQFGLSGWNRITRRAYLRREARELVLDMTCFEGQEK